MFKPSFLILTVLFTAVSSCSDLPTIASQVVTEADRRIMVALPSKEYPSDGIVDAIIFNKGKKTLEMGVCPVILERFNITTEEWEDAWPMPEVCILPLWTTPSGGHRKFPVQLRNDAPGVYRIRLPEMWFEGQLDEGRGKAPVHTPEFKIVSD